MGLDADSRRIRSYGSITQPACLGNPYFPNRVTYVSMPSTYTADMSKKLQEIDIL
jgi:hypothetical protein